MAYVGHLDHLLITKLTSSHLQHLPGFRAWDLMSGAPVTHCILPSTWQTCRVLAGSTDGDSAQGGVSGGEVDRA